jgi:hypothetical protein
MVLVPKVIKVYFINNNFLRIFSFAGKVLYCTKNFRLLILPELLLLRKRIQRWFGAAARL